MAIYAVIKTGGKQYRVAPGDVVKVEKLGIASGGTVEISEVYLIADDHDITVGHPTIANARVVAEVVGEGRGEKIITFKKKRRKGYQRTIGHRQYFTTLKISPMATTEFETVRPPEAGADQARGVRPAPALPTREAEPPRTHTPAIPQPQ